MIENIVLDWAGTMADDIHLTLAATNVSLERFGGKAVDLATYRRDFRIPVMEFYGPRVREGTTLEEIDDVFFEAYRKDVSKVALYEGMEELLRTSHRRGRKLFVLSTVPTDILEEGLRAHGLLDLFTEIYGNAFDKRPVLPRLIEEHGLDPAETLYVGDTGHDVETAHVAKVRAGASLYGYGLEEALTAERPDYLFHDVAQISAQLDREHLLDTVPMVIATVGGILRRPDGKILVVRTRKWSNTFGIPGGKIDYGETMVDAYAREMKEETGLDAENHRFVMIQDCIESKEFLKRRHFLLINYLSDVADDRGLRTNYEIEESRWVTLDEAMSLHLNEPTRILFEEVRKKGLLQ